MMSIKLKSLCKRFSSGDRIDSNTIIENGKYPVFGGNGIRGYSNTYNFDGRCAIIGRQGANCGNVRYFEGKAYMTEHAIVVEANEKNDIGFLAYKMSLMNLSRYQGQSAQPGLSVKTISEIQVEVPELNIQRRIWKVLKSIDEKIDNNELINTKLEESLKLLYQRWFIEFEFPNKQGVTYKSFGGKLIYNNIIKSEIPENWKIENCLNNSLYAIIKPGVPYFQKKNYLATANVDGNKILDGEWIDYENRESRANMQSIPYSVWFAKMKNSIKHITIPKDSEWFNRKYVLSTGFLGIKCKENALSYLHCFINSNYFEKIKDMLAHGATQQAINNEDLKAINLLIPNDEILLKFENLTKNIIQKEFDIIKENQRLLELKNYLLPLLINGQINVDNIEI